MICEVRGSNVAILNFVVSLGEGFCINLPCAFEMMAFCWDFTLRNPYTVHVLNIHFACWCLFRLVILSGQDGEFQEAFIHLLHTPAHKNIALKTREEEIGYTVAIHDETLLFVWKRRQYKLMISSTYNESLWSHLIFQPKGKGMGNPAASYRNSDSTMPCFLTYLLS